MTSNRESNVMVTVLDGKGIGKMVRDQQGDKLPKEATLKVSGEYAFVRTNKGTFILDNDGYGPADPLEKHSVNVDLTRDDTMDWTPYAVLSINHLNILTLPTLPEKVNLAKFIRVFGGRLENNFDQWNKFFAKTKPAEDNF